MKRITMLIAGLFFILSSLIGIYAYDTGAQHGNNDNLLAFAANYYTWRITEVLQDYTTVYGTYQFFYEGHPAESSGEIDTINSTRSVSNDYYGSIAFGLKKNIEISLGYSFTDTRVLSASKQSRTLNRGEYVRGYWRPIYSQSKVVQREYYRLDGYETATGASKICYGKEAVGIGLKLEYYSAYGLKVETEYFHIYKQ